MGLMERGESWGRAERGRTGPGVGEGLGGTSLEPQPRSSEPQTSEYRPLKEGEPHCPHDSHIFSPPLPSHVLWSHANGSSKWKLPFKIAFEITSYKKSFWKNEQFRNVPRIFLSERRFGIHYGGLLFGFGPGSGVGLRLERDWPRGLGCDLC